MIVQPRFVHLYIACCFILAACSQAASPLPYEYVANTLAERDAGSGSYKVLHDLGRAPMAKNLRPTY